MKFIITIIMILLCAGVSSAFNVTEEAISDGYEYVLWLNESELPFNHVINMTLGVNETNITYDVYKSGSGQTYVGIDSLIVVPDNVTSVLVPIGIVIPNLTAPDIYLTNISIVRYNFTRLVKVKINLESVVEDYYNVTPPDYIDNDRDNYYFAYYDVMLPITGKDDNEWEDLTISAPPDSLVNVSCDSWLLCPLTNFSMPSNGVKDYRVKLNIPNNVELKEYHKKAVFTRGNKSVTINFHIKLLKAPIEVFQIPTDFDRSISEMTPDELRMIFETLNEATEDSLQALEAANKTEIREVAVEVDRYVPVANVDKQIDQLRILTTSVNSFNEYRATNDEDLANITHTVMILVNGYQNVTDNMVFMQQAYLDEKNSLERDLYEEGKSNRRQTVWTVVIAFFVVTIVGGAYLYFKHMEW